MGHLCSVPGPVLQASSLGDICFPEGLAVKRTCAKAWEGKKDMTQLLGMEKCSTGDKDPENRLGVKVQVRSMVKDGPMEILDSCEGHTRRFELELDRGH